MKQVNHYVAYSEWHQGCRSAVYQGIASDEEEFKAMCREMGFELDGLEVVEERRNVKDEMGRPYPPKVWQDE